jgi:hypothetical protein
LLRQVGSKLLRRRRSCLGTHFRERLLDLIAGKRARRRVVDLLPDGDGCAWRRNNEIDRCGDELIESALHHGWNLRCQRTAGLAGHGQPPQATIANIRQHLGQGREEEMNFAAQKARQSRAAAAIGNVPRFDLSADVQQLALEMRQRADPRRGVPQHTRL